MENKEEGLIPKLIKEWKFRKQFTKEELQEIDQIKKEAFILKMKELAKKDGEKLALDKMKESKRR